MLLSMKPPRNLRSVFAVLLVIFANSANSRWHLCEMTKTSVAFLFLLIVSQNFGFEKHELDSLWNDFKVSVCCRERKRN